MAEPDKPDRPWTFESACADVLEAFDGHMGMVIEPDERRWVVFRRTHKSTTTHGDAWFSVEYRIYHASVLGQDGPRHARVLEKLGEKWDVLGGVSGSDQEEATSAAVKAGFVPEGVATCLPVAVPLTFVTLTEPQRAELERAARASRGAVDLLRSKGLAKNKANMWRHLCRNGFAEQFGAWKFRITSLGRGALKMRDDS